IGRMSLDVRREINKMIKNKKMIRSGVGKWGCWIMKSMGIERVGGNFGMKRKSVVRCVSVNFSLWC
ncbi:hypothetical protein, partial [Priestia megaterium]|uniref:hypothetical protein n=1 Tax=Priestia megaterium TaxID=1404 RepID=UPI001C99D675